MDEEDYDVVSVVLQEHADRLEKMDKNSDLFGIMQQIRLEHRDEIEKAIRMWKNRSK